MAGEYLKDGIPYLCADLLLILSGEVDEMIIFGANQERNGGFVEASSLPIPLFDAVECTLPCEIEHEENCNSIIADQRKHVDKFSLATQIPDGECDFSIADRYGLLHEIDPLVSSAIITTLVLDVHGIPKV